MPHAPLLYRRFVAVLCAALVVFASLLHAMPGLCCPKAEAKREATMARACCAHKADTASQSPEVDGTGHQAPRNQPVCVACPKSFNSEQPAVRIAAGLAPAALPFNAMLEPSLFHHTRMAARPYAPRPPDAAAGPIYLSLCILRR